MVEDWVAEVCKLAGKVKVGKDLVTSYMPEKTPKALTQWPSAITYIEAVRPKYSAGGPNIFMWEGVTEFHVFPDIEPTRNALFQRVFGEIVRAFASNLSLTGKVAYFALREDGLESAQLKFGEEAPHAGIIARWVVKEIVQDLIVA